MKVVHSVFIGEPDKGGSKRFEVRGDFGAEMGFAPDEGVAGEKGEPVAVEVISVVKTSEEVTNVAVRGRLLGLVLLRRSETYTGAVDLFRCTRVGSSSSSSSSSMSARSCTGRESSSLVLSSLSS